jgi:SAM-dependent methyltransferase
MVDEVRGLLLPPFRALAARLPGIRLHRDPYQGPFEAYHFYASGAQTWDLDALAELVTGPVLDVGCGRGRLSLRLARAGHRVTALDTSAPALAALRTAVAAEPALRDHLEVVAGDVTHPATLPAGRYRTVALADLTVNHFATPAALGALLGAVDRLLAPNGVLVLPVLTTAGADSYAGTAGMMAVPYPDGDRQRLMWLSLRHDPAGPYLYRTLFTQDDTGPDGAVAGHLTAVRERLWTAEALAPALADAGLRVASRRPVDAPGLGGRALPAEVLSVTR